MYVCMYVNVKITEGNGLSMYSISSHITFLEILTNQSTD